ncbi:hypothetical protein [Actinophytocola sp.]|jgi:hypothetical protein|uniref:hypothetical protein n=1 Tax=Actinophytocola sp. TaxID=1872138 RepID=UPI00389A6E0A
MVYLLAAIGAVCVVVLLWRAFAANPTMKVGDRRVSGPSRSVAPDDDPEFLRSLNQRKNNPPEADGKEPPA